jgi:hypothetical protein
MTEQNNLPLCCQLQKRLMNPEVTMNGKYLYVCYNEWLEAVRSIELCKNCKRMRFRMNEIIIEAKMKKWKSELNKNC